MATGTSSASLYIIQVRFCRALAVVRSLPTESGGAFQPSVADKLNFYGLYKQTLVGDCMVLKPSSRNIVQYAKWKSWDRLRGVSPIDAQIMYIDALIDLLKEFLRKYPDSELTSSLNESLDYLQEQVEDTTIVNTDKDVQWDTNDQEKEEYYLGHIEKEQLMSEQEPTLYSSPITSEFPMTPELSPRFSSGNSVIKSPLHQQQEHPYYLYPFTTTHVIPNHQDDDGDDLLDNEVATATSSLYLSTPNQHPYNTSFSRKSNNNSKRKSTKPSSSNRAIQTLQTEVAALCQEIDHLRRTSKQKSLLSHWRWLWLFKSIAKHALFNFLILLLVFFVLWRKKSPIAYAVIQYIGPRTRDLIRYVLTRTLYVNGVVF